MRVPLVLACGALGLGSLSAALVQEQEPRFRGDRVAGQVGMITGTGGNIGVMSGQDGVLMIDTQFARNEAGIREAMATLTDGTPVWVINTHAHGDHVGGNLAFSEGSLIVAHERVRARMEDGGGRIQRADPAALPDLTYQTSMTLHLNGEPVELLHMPMGHTDGDTVVFFPDSKVVHMGDLLFHQRFPFIDLDSGGSLSGYLNALRALHARIPADYKVIPGHGPLATKADVAASIAMIEASMKLVQERLDQGMDAQAVVDAGMPEAWADWSWGFINTDSWLATVRRGLIEEARAAQK